MRSGAGRQRSASRRRRAGQAGSLLEALAAHLPLFDALPEGAIERLAAGGLGRGLLTASLRARLRRAGFADMGRLARATPGDLSAVRKIGPVRVGAIRAHVLDELARLYPGARAEHCEGATEDRRMERLRAIPVKRLALEAVTVAGLGRGGGSCADLVLDPQAGDAPAPGIPVADFDRIVTALAQVLLPDQPPAHPSALAQEDEATEARARQERAEALRQRDREWDEAAPPRYGCPEPGSRGRP